MTATQPRTRPQSRRDGPKLGRAGTANSKTRCQSAPALYQKHTEADETLGDSGTKLQVAAEMKTQMKRLACNDDVTEEPETKSLFVEVCESYGLRKPPMVATPEVVPSRRPSCSSGRRSAPVSCVGADGANQSAKRRQRKPCSAGKPPKEYLRDHWRHQQALSELREAKADHAKSELLYHHLSRMNEANCWAEELALPTRYQPHTLENGEVVCHVYERGFFVKELNLDIFERRHRALQGRKCLSALSRKPDVPSNSSSTDARLKSMIPGKVSKAQSRLSPDEQQELQGDIRRVTLETLALVEKMRQQLELMQVNARPANPFVIH